MTTLASRKRRERTNSGRKRAAQVFTSPGEYFPEFGKSSIYLSGRGQPGFSPQNSSVSNYNPPTPGNISGYNPTIPGTYVNTNPVTPGTYAGTNATTPSTVAYYNPSTGGNVAGYNPTIPGTIAYNPPVQGQIIYTIVTNVDGATFSYYYTSGEFAIAPYSYYNPSNSQSVTGVVSRPAGFYVSGGSYYNPSVVGGAYYNSTKPGNAVYNPAVPGTAFYNLPTPGTANYNPTVASTANYNPAVPGNANYNNYIAGEAGKPFSALGVIFPGGAIGTAAPAVTRALVYAPYQPNGKGYPVSVEPGGIVTIEEE